jgi:hypothetical protein
MFPVILPLFACSMEDPNLEELRRLCEKDAGVNIYRTVDAKGYYDGEKRGRSLEVLVRSDFDFIEFCNERPILKTLLQEPGCARYTRVPADSGRCSNKVQEILESSFGEPYASFRSDYCVQFELIDKPSARYFYQSELLKLHTNENLGSFSRSRVWITDTHSVELMAEYITYLLVPRPDSMVYKTCDDIDQRYPNLRDADLIETVLSKSEK